MQLSISVEGLFGLNWSRWKMLTQAVEAAGYHALYCSDHFLFLAPPDVDSLEVYSALTYLADHSERLELGTLVSPLSFRDPVMMARQAIAINDLSGGRMILGLGTGWLEREHTMFGYDLGTLKTRLDRFEEGLEVIARLTRDNEPVTFEGRFYHLQEACLLPRSERRLRLLIGAGGKQRTLPLTARYADVWNALPNLTVEDIRERNALLDDLLRHEGRRPGDLKRTVARPIMCWRTAAERERMAEIYRGVVNLLPSLPTDELIQRLQEWFNALCGTPDEVIEQLRMFEAAGIEELMCQYVTLNSLEPLQVIAETVLPHFSPNSHG
jgi:alkanesulfonate monooxygenase SsuD/methylene tetrahydromethanopterin reductase-like flavin-dependent oxidoreductase (luciferase family)